MAQGFWPLARRERRASPVHGSVRSEQRSRRPKDQARMGKVILARPLGSPLNHPRRNRGSSREPPNFLLQGLRPFGTFSGPVFANVSPLRDGNLLYPRWIIHL